jgi:hypothetical protein
LASTFTPELRNRSSERKGVFGWNVYAEIGQCADTVRHEPFTAWFVDGRNCAIGERDVETLLARCDGGGESGRPTANDEDFGVHTV